MKLTRNRRNTDADAELAEFFFLIDLTALVETIYVPLSVASSKKPTGFVYQIEGTAPGAIVAATVSCKGEGVTQITLGTILYAKISKGMTATFRILVHMRGREAKSYKIIINRINYKHDLNTLRYESLLTALTTEMLRIN